MSDTPKQVVVITGATRGIGRNMALLFAGQGHTVIGTGRDAARLEELQEELRRLAGSGLALQTDVREADSVQQAAARVHEAYGRIDTWINNAGVFAAIGPMWETDPAQWAGDLTTNVIGTYHGVRAAVPYMLKQGGGRIINVVGGGTVGVMKYGSGYGTSKTAVARLTENLDAELEGTGVLAFSLDPGLNDTDMTKYQRETAAGQTYMPGITAAFAEHRDVPPSWAPELASAVAAGRLDAYRGRIVTVYDDADKLAGQAEALEGTDRYKLRITRLDGVSRDR